MQQLCNECSRLLQERSEANNALLRMIGEMQRARLVADRSSDRTERKAHARRLCLGNGRFRPHGGIDPRDLNELKRSFSVQVVEAATKRFGWMLEKKSDVQYVALRRA